MLPQISSSTAPKNFPSSPKNEAAFSLPETRLAQVGLPMPSVMPDLPAAALAANAVKAAFAARPALGVMGLVGAAVSSFAEQIVARLSGNLPSNVSTREIQMASVAMNDMKISADDLAHLTSEQKAFFVKAAASLVETQRDAAAPGRNYMAALGILLDKAGKISPHGIKTIAPDEARRMFGLPPQGAPESLSPRSSFPGPDANSRGPGEGLLVNPGAPDFKLPTDTGQRERTENLSPAFMEAERPKLRGQRGGNEPVQPFGDTLTADQIELTATRLANGHAWEKHAEEFKELGINNQEEFKSHLASVLQNMGLTSQTKIVDYDRLVYDPDSNTMIVLNAETGYPKTAYRPENGASYYYSRGKKRR